MRNLEVDGGKLRTLREASGVSVAQLAEACGCTIWNIYRLESPKKQGQPSAELYGRLKTALTAFAGRDIGDDDLLVDDEEESADGEGDAA